MDVDHAKALREAWHAEGNPPCPHSRLDAESTEMGYFTGQYVCKTCGEYVPLAGRSLATSASEKTRERGGWSRYAFYTSMGLLAAAVPVFTVWYKRRRRTTE